jgi:ketosteroid isomerase-like protein
MNTSAVVFSVVLLSSTPVIASDKTDVVAVVHKWVDSFNKGDSTSALATCAEESAIIDDVSPYEWQGPGACKAWYNDLNAWFKQNDGVFDHTTVDKVRNVKVTGDHAFVVVSATFAFKVKDALQSEKGIWTFGMKKGTQGWRITGWAWAPPPSK